MSSHSVVETLMTTTTTHTKMIAVEASKTVEMNHSRTTGTAPSSSSSLQQLPPSSTVETMSSLSSCDTETSTTNHTNSTTAMIPLTSQHPKLLTIKTTCEEEKRRFQIPFSLPSTITAMTPMANVTTTTTSSTNLYDAIKTKIASLYHLTSPFTIQYTDEENDDITVTNDDDLYVAIRCMSHVHHLDDVVLHLNIVIDDEVEEEQEEEGVDQNDDDELVEEEEEDPTCTQSTSNVLSANTATEYLEQSTSAMSNKRSRNRYRLKSFRRHNAVTRGSHASRQPLVVTQQQLQSQQQRQAHVLHLSQNQQGYNETAPRHMIHTVPANIANPIFNAQNSPHVHPQFYQQQGISSVTMSNASPASIIIPTKVTPSHQVQNTSNVSISLFPISMPKEEPLPLKHQLQLLKLEYKAKRQHLANEYKHKLLKLKQGNAKPNSKLDKKLQQQLNNVRIIAEKQKMDVEQQQFKILNQFERLKLKRKNVAVDDVDLSSRLMWPTAIDKVYIHGNNMFCFRPLKKYMKKDKSIAEKILVDLCSSFYAKMQNLSIVGVIFDDTRRVFENIDQNNRSFLVINASLERKNADDVIIDYALEKKGGSSIASSSLFVTCDRDLRQVLKQYDCKCVHPQKFLEFIYQLLDTHDRTLEDWLSQDFVPDVF
jgi:hypothetical protein